MSEFGLLVVAFALTGAVFFAYDMLMAPVILHEGQEERIRQGREIIDRITDKHDLLDRIIALHDDLVDAYDEGYGTEAEQAAWFARMFYL